MTSTTSSYSPPSGGFRRVILPGSEGTLLRRELAQAFVEEGLPVDIVPPEELHDPAGERRLERLLQDGPALLFSVNFQGLHPLRSTCELLGKSGSAAAVWLVDNPWNILSGVRDPRWKDLPLFVTDDFFLPPLAAHGARAVRHLPLAASFACFGPNARRDAAFPPPLGLAPFVFVGRSAFPGKESFFAGQTLPPDAVQEALALLEAGGRPDLAWWERRTGTAGASFWPGKKARAAALGAEEANLVWRASCVSGAAGGGAGGVDIFGDKGWLDPAAGLSGPRGAGGVDIFGDKGWLDPAAGLSGPRGATASGPIRLFPPVDYYARLPGVYRTARYSLCLTSLQLPHGLNQRHFDVWAAGGVALCDATPGLELFPEDLTRPLIFKRAADIVRVAERLEAGQGRADLIRGWQQCLAEGHTYRHRVRTVLEVFS